MRSENKILLIVLGSFFGLVLGGGVGCIGPFWLTKMENPGDAFGMMCGASFLGLMIGALAGLGIIILFEKSADAKGEVEEEEEPADEFDDYDDQPPAPISEQ